ALRHQIAVYKRTVTRPTVEANEVLAKDKLSSTPYTVGAPRVRERKREPTSWDMGTIECKRSRDAPIAEGVGLADQRTAQRLASGGSVGECPGRQENGAEVQEKVAPRRAGIRRTLPFTLSRCSALW